MRYHLIKLLFLKKYFFVCYEKCIYCNYFYNISRISHQKLHLTSYNMTENQKNGSPFHLIQFYVIKIIFKLLF